MHFIGLNAPKSSLVLLALVEGGSMDLLDLGLSVDAQLLQGLRKVSEAV